MSRAGIPEAWQEVGKYFAHVRGDGQFDSRRREQAISWWQSLVEQELRLRFLAEPHVAALAKRLEASVLAGTLAPSLAAEELLDGAGLKPTAIA